MGQKKRGELADTERSAEGSAASVGGADDGRRVGVAARRSLGGPSRPAARSRQTAAGRHRDCAECAQGKKALVGAHGRGGCLRGGQGAAAAWGEAVRRAARIGTGQTSGDRKLNGRAPSCRGQHAHSGGGGGCPIARSAAAAPALPGASSGRRPQRTGRTRGCSGR